MTHGITRDLAEFATRPLARASCTAALSILRLSWFDWLAVGIAGAQEPAARIVRDMVLDESGVAQAALFGTRTRLPARAAALANGTASHALDYDDTHFAHIGHPSVAVLPAVMAMAARMGVSGKAAQEAALIGVEGAIRVGIWLGRDHYQAGFHQTATAGAFGATMAAGRLLGLNAEPMAHGLGLCATRASGLKSQFGTMGKPLNAGLAAANGVEMADLAARGFLSRSDGMETAQGFGPTHHGALAQAQALAGLGEDWLFASVRHKFHACCHGLHAMLEAFREIAPTLDAHRVSGVEVTTHPRWMSVCNISRPRTGLEAKFSYRLTAAMALAGVDTGALSSFSAENAVDPGLMRLRDLVRVSADPELKETQARISIEIEDGSTLGAFHDLEGGVPLNMLSERLGAKAVSLLGTDRADDLRAATEVLDLQEIEALMAAA
ncbi:MAG: MmgE/PrpD family protein [Brevirhabdus sp.]